MSAGERSDLPNLRAIRAAILAAPPRPPGFPLGALNDPDARQKVLAAPHLQQFLADMRAEAARAQAAPLAPLTFSLFHRFETTGDRVAYERAYFDRYRRVAGLALATTIDATDNYLPALHDLLWEVCNEYTWALPAHLPVGMDAVAAYRVPPEQVVDLFAAHTAHMLAEVSSLLGERLDPWLHYRIRHEIERRIFLPVFYDPRHFDWEAAAMNWAAVCGGCIGMAALLLEDDRERLAGMIDRSVRTMACFLDGFGADGGCPEGISYWVYGVGFYTYFAAMLSDLTAGQLDLLQNERVRAIAAFPQVVSLGGGKYINYSDAPEQATLHPGLGSYLAAHLQQPIPDLKPPGFHGDAIHRWGHITRDLLWTDASLLQQPVTEQAAFLPDLGWVIDRRILDGVTVTFSAKGGHNDEPHNHNDLGHFIVHLGGDSLLADLGAGVYTRQYFGPERYDDLHTGSQGHSVPLINGQPQQAGPDHHAVVVDYQARPHGVAFTLDLTGAYVDATLLSFARSFEWVVDAARQTATLRLVDRFNFTALPAGVEECFISLFLPTVQADMVRWQGRHGVVELSFDGNRFEPLVEVIETQTHQLEPVTVYRLRLRARQAELTRTAGFEFTCQLLKTSDE
ncbi:MAG: heparinase II/III family protein [Anaerolineae bacterium]|nr:heparinase II/III family protein [Anaerolineae bacterium]